MEASEMTYGQFGIPNTLSDRIAAWQQAWENLYRRPMVPAEAPLEEHRRDADRRHVAEAHLLGLAYVLLSDLQEGSTHHSQRVVPDRMPGGPNYPYESPYDGARGPFDPCEPAPGAPGNGDHGAHAATHSGAAR